MTSEAHNTPCYDIIKALKKVGLISPEDRSWIEINLITNNQAFVKYNCECVNRKKAESNKSKSNINTSAFGAGNKEIGIEVILKPYGCIENKKKVTYYIGQCLRCENIYWIIPEDTDTHACGVKNAD